MWNCLEITSEKVILYSYFGIEKVKIVTKIQHSHCLIFWRRKNLDNWINGSRVKVWKTWFAGLRSWTSYLKFSLQTIFKLTCRRKCVLGAFSRHIIWTNPIYSVIGCADLNVIFYLRAPQNKNIAVHAFVHKNLKVYQTDKMKKARMEPERSISKNRQK